MLLAHRRAGTRAGLLPWAALIAGTVASLAARRGRTTQRTGPRTAGARSRTDDADLVAAAQTARSELAAAGHRLNRQSLTRKLRQGGYAVSNARAGELLTLLRESEPAPVNGARPDLAAADGGERDA